LVKYNLDLANYPDPAIAITVTLRQITVARNGACRSGRMLLIHIPVTTASGFFPVGVTTIKRQDSSVIFLCWDRGLEPIHPVADISIS
jgi:hypothetical protein